MIDVIGNRQKVAAARQAAVDLLESYGCDDGLLMLELVFNKLNEYGVTLAFIDPPTSKPDAT